MKPKTLHITMGTAPWLVITAYINHPDI